MPVSELTAGVIHLSAQAAFLRGDANLDASLAIADPVRILNFNFTGGVSLGCMDAADSNDDGRVDISDSVFLLRYLIVGGKPPPPPLAQPGIDGTDDQLGCAQPLFSRS